MHDTKRNINDQMHRPKPDIIKTLQYSVRLHYSWRMGIDTNGRSPKSGYLYLCVSVSGASVLAVEILGTRILGPFYGVSLFLWSALITVTLAALSIGYMLGGRWADSGATYPRLSLLLAAAGAWLLVVPWIRHPVLAIIEPGGLRTAVLVSSFVLFFPPLTFLGMISPYAIKLNTETLGEIGRSAGDIYAISTVASVAAALLTGFILIPRIGVIRLTVAVGIVLLATASIGLLWRGGARTALVTIALLIAGIASFLAAAASEGKLPDGVVSCVQSPYGEIRVVDRYDSRYLLIDGGIHTEVGLPDLEPRSAYVNVLDIAGSFFRRPGDLLLIGLGGGSVVKSYARGGWRIDAVEIDRAVTKVAREYFGLEPEEAIVHHGDGRRYVATCDDAYDVIILDAFGSSSIPFHLVTREAFGLISSRLKPGGILALNVISVGWRDLLVRSLAATLETRFSSIRALPIAEPPNRLGNVILLARNGPLELPEQLPPSELRDSAEYDRNHAWDNRFEPETKGAPVLMDDRNLVDLWAERINLEMRKGLHAHFEGASSW